MSTDELHPLVVFLHRCDDTAECIAALKAQAHISPAAALLHHLYSTQVPYADSAGEFEAAEAAEKHPHLRVLLLLEWAMAAFGARRLGEGSAAINKARSLVSEHSHPELRGGLIVVQSRHALAEWREKEACRMSLQAMQILPKGTLLWRRACRDYIERMRFLECGYSVLEELQYLHQYWPRESEMLKFSTGHLANTVATGNLAEAVPIFDEMRTRQQGNGQLRTYAFYRALFDLMSGSLPGAAAMQPRASVAEDREWVLKHCPVDIQSMLDCTRHLLAQQPKRALDAARLYVQNLGEHYFKMVRFDFYDLLRAELVNGHAKAAENVMLRHLRVRERHYFDNFFEARIALLNGQTDAAEQLFAATVQDAIRHQAEKRLAFELQLALEVPHRVLIRWHHQIQYRSPLAQAHNQSPRNQASVPAAALSENQPRTQTLNQQKPRKESVRTVVASVRPIVAPKLIGGSPAMDNVRLLVERFAALPLPVLVTGETGTGKDLVARALHAESPRREKPFLAINCAAICGSLLLSELFGSVRGAFTGAVRDHAGLFESAGEGTLFLDEIGEIPPELQAALLRVLESGEYLRVGSTSPRTARCRIIAATNRDLAAASQQGGFRSDLYFRLRRLSIHLPPLRQRREDILPLALHFLQADTGGGTPVTTDSALAQALTAYDWPGNVRELRSSLELLRIMASERGNYTYSDLLVALPTLAEKALPPDAPPVLSQPILAQSATPVSAGVSGALAAVSHSGILGVTSPSMQRVRMDRVDRLKKLFRDQRNLTCREVAQILGVSRPTVTKLMEGLVDEGFIEKVMPNRSPTTHYYALRPVHSPGS